MFTHTQLSYFCHHCREQVYVGHNMACIVCGGRSVEIYDPLKHMMFSDHIETVLTIIEDLRILDFSAHNNRSSRTRTFERPRRSEIAADIRNYLPDDVIGDFALELLASEDCVRKSPHRSTKLKTKISTSDGSCSICLSDYKRGDKGFLFSCQHFFHTRCAAGWLRSHNTCPNCRRKLE
eukprot:jgi/Antlo1/2025/1005